MKTNKPLFEERTFLILDYISQILVYGANIDGKLHIKVGDDNFLYLAVAVIKNNYFRYHNLGISKEDYLEFIIYLKQHVTAKFKSFDLMITEQDISILSKVNHNQIDLYFT